MDQKELTYKIIQPNGEFEFVKANTVRALDSDKRIVLQMYEDITAIVGFDCRVIQVDPIEMVMRREEIKKAHAIRLAKMVVDATAGIVAAFPRADHTKFKPAGTSGHVTIATEEDVEKAKQAILKAANKNTRKRWWQW